METKICTKCNQEKKIFEFYKQKSGKFGVMAICILCDKKYRQTDADKKSIKKYQQTEAFKKSQKKYRMSKIFKESRKNKLNTDPIFRFINLTRSRLSNFFNGQKSASTEELVGCSYKFAVKWIEIQFTPEMNWNNIHIDHIRPLISFENIQNNKETQFNSCNWKNLQPLLVKDNLEKSDKWDGTDENLTFSRQALSPEVKRNLIKEFELKLSKEVE